MDGRARSFGERLKTLRRRTGKTQLEVAQELKAQNPDLAISQANFSHLEQRKTAPRPAILETLADYFGVKVDYFLRDEDESFESRRPHIASYFQRLMEQAIPEGELLLHTDDNSSGDRATLDTTDNLLKFYRNTDIAGK